MTDFRFLLLIAVCITLGCSPNSEPAPPNLSSSPDEPLAVEHAGDHENPLTILYLGDSLTAGYGLAGGADEAYPAILQSRIDSLGIPARTINAGVSGDTSSGGRGRIGWYLDRNEVDILVLALGANDGLRGLPPATLESNLLAIIDATREAHPDSRIVLAGMLTPVSMGGDYFREFEEVFPRVAAAREVSLVPFLLEGVAAIPEMNQADGIHPTRAGQQRMADNVWSELEPVLIQAASARDS